MRTCFNLCYVIIGKKVNLEMVFLELRTLLWEVRILNTLEHSALGS